MSIALKYKNWGWGWRYVNIDQNAFVSWHSAQFHAIKYVLKKLKSHGLCTEVIYNPSFSSVQSLNHVQLFATPWTAAHQASLSITNSQSLLKLMSIESVMPFNHLILCRPLSPPAFNLSQHQGLFQ